MNGDNAKQGSLWIIISLAPGVSLADYMKDAQPVGLRSVTGFCLKLLRIVESFHARGVVHRDLKPDNIHIDCPNNCSLDEGTITILDFPCNHQTHFGRR